MAMNDFNDYKPALEYIRKRGYASYSSLKMVRDGGVPFKSTAGFFDIGTLVHSILLEGYQDKSVLKRLTPEELETARAMVAKLKKNSVVTSLLKNSKNEQKFTCKINGLPVVGYIDIHGKDAIGDLKTTRLTSRKAFQASMDFLQAAVYMHATGKKDFIYIGISKISPYEVFTFNVNEEKSRLEKAFGELDQLTKFIRKCISSTLVNKGH